MARYFEDVEIGTIHETRRYDVTKEEIIKFASCYDPQPFHLDDEAAKDSIFGGLVASGWHTAAICMRLLVDDFLDPESSMGARGVDSLRWIRPVFPGDSIYVTIEAIEKRPSESRPEMGHVRSQMTGFNQNDEPVIQWESMGMVRRRNPEQ